MHKLLISIWLNQLLVFFSSQVFFYKSFKSQECIALTPTCSSSLHLSRDLSQAVTHMEFPRCSLSVCTAGVWAASRVPGRSRCCTTCSPLRVDNSEFNRCLLGWTGRVILRPGPGTAHGSGAVACWLLCRCASAGLCAEVQCSMLVVLRGGPLGASPWQKVPLQELKMRCEPSTAALRS